MNRMKIHAAALITVLMSVVMVLGVNSGCGIPDGDDSSPSGTPQESPYGAVTPSPSPLPSPEPTPEPSLVPTLSPEELIEERTRSILDNMTEEQKIYQLFVVYPEDVTGVSPVTVAGEITRLALEKYPVGGFIYSQKNLISQEQAKTMVENQQDFSPIPLLTCLDEEGGMVSRLMNRVGTTHIDSMFSYRDQGPDRAFENAATIAGDMLSLGFNTDFAPVADVWTNPANTVIGSRAYSDSFDQAAELVSAAVRGFKDGGVICTLKHFPGHGDTYEDSHSSLTIVHRSVDELREGEFLPFKSGIDAGADMVMVGHLAVEELGDTPADFSREIVTGLLREELGFKGVVVTDGLAMSGATNYASCGELCVQALEAGCDILLGPADMQEGVQGILDALDSGRLSAERIDESVLRILTMKIENGLISDTFS